MKWMVLIIGVAACTPCDLSYPHAEWPERDRDEPVREQVQPEPREPEEPKEPEGY